MSHFETNDPYTNLNQAIKQKIVFAATVSLKRPTYAATVLMMIFKKHLFKFLYIQNVMFNVLFAIYL